MIYVSTHAGKRHSLSEDAVLVGEEVVSDASGVYSMPEAGFVCIADGVGGNRGGAQASGFVLDALAKWKDEPEKNLKSFLIRTNDALITFASADRASSAMATTLTGICISDTGCRLVHIGNTRAYVKQGKYLKQITADHTTYNWLMSSGQTEAAERCNRNEITNCFGGKDPALLSKLYVADCQPFSLVLLTSDGVHEYVDLDTLEDIIAGEGLYDEKCEAVIHKALNAGSEDDLSVVIIVPLEGHDDHNDEVGQSETNDKEAGQSRFCQRPL